MSKPEPAQSHLGLVGGIVAAFALLLCCAGPALIAGGVLSGIGGVLNNPFVIAAGVLLMVTGIGVTLRKLLSGKATCDPSASDTTRDSDTGTQA
jgi:hypothetical protein